jgi:transmembrane protein EpsG
MIWVFVSVFAWFSQLFAQRLFVIPFFCSLILLSGFRYYVGSDFANYVILFDTAAKGQLIPVEPSYFLLSQLFSSLSLNFQSIILFYTVFTYVFVFLGYKELSNSKSFMSVTLLLVYLVFYFPSLSIMRQALAASIGFWATVKFLYVGRKSWYFFWVFFASFFHLSVLILLFNPLFKYIKLSRMAYFLVICFAFLLGATVFRDLLNIFFDILGVNIKNHMNKGFGVVSPIFMINSLVLVVVFFLILPKKNKKLDTTELFLLNIVFAIIIIRMLSIEFIVFNRLASVYTVFLPLFIYTFFYQRLKKYSKFLFMLILLPLLLLSDIFRLSKDYSYYQYSFNFCIIGEPCPIQLFGNQDPKLIKHVE